MRPRSRLWSRALAVRLGPAGLGYLTVVRSTVKVAEWLQPIDHVGHTGGNPAGEVSGKALALSEQPVHRKPIAEWGLGRMEWSVMWKEETSRFCTQIPAAADFPRALLPCLQGLWIPILSAELSGLLSK